MSDVADVLSAPGARAGTGREPRGASAASRTALVERKKRVVLAAAVPPPWFLVVSLTVKVAAGARGGGPVKTLTARSGPTTTRAKRVLLVSLVSRNAEPASARART